MGLGLPKGFQEMGGERGNEHPPGDWSTTRRAVCDLLGHQWSQRREFQVVMGTFYYLRTNWE